MTPEQDAAAQAELAELEAQQEDAEALQLPHVPISRPLANADSTGQVQRHPPGPCSLQIPLTDSETAAICVLHVRCLLASVAAWSHRLVHWQHMRSPRFVI